MANSRVNPYKPDFSTLSWDGAKTAGMWSAFAVGTPVGIAAGLGGAFVGLFVGGPEAGIGTGAIGAVVSGAAAGIVGAGAFSLPVAWIADETRDFRENPAIENNLEVLSLCKDSLTKKYVIKKILAERAFLYTSASSNYLLSCLYSSSLDDQWSALMDYMVNARTTNKFQNNVYIHNGKKFFNKILDILGHIRPGIEGINNGNVANEDKEKIKKTLKNDFLQKVVSGTYSMDIEHLLKLYNNVGVKTKNEFTLNTDKKNPAHLEKNALVLAILKNNTEAIDEFIRLELTNIILIAGAAIVENKIEVIQHLVSNHRLDVNHQISFANNYSLLQFADLYEKKSIADFLIRNGANDNETNQMRNALSSLIPIIITDSWKENGQGLFWKCIPDYVKDLREIVGEEFTHNNYQDVINNLDRYQVRNLVDKMKDALSNCNADDDLSGRRSKQARDLYALVKNIDGFDENDSRFQLLHQWTNVNTISNLPRLKYASQL